MRRHEQVCGFRPAAVHAREQEKLRRHPPKPKREKRRKVQCEDCDQKEAVFHLPQPPAGEAASAPPPPAMATATAKKARTATFSQRFSETAKVAPPVTYVCEHSGCNYSDDVFDRVAQCGPCRPLQEPRAPAPA